MVDDSLRFDSNLGPYFTLYRIKNTKNYYYYFTYDKKKYRGSTRIDDIQKSKIFVIDLIHDLIHGISKPRTKGIKKGTKSNPNFKMMVEYFNLDKKDELTEIVKKKNKSIQKKLIEYFGDWRLEDFKKYENDILFTHYQQWRKEYYIDKDYIISGRNMKNFVVSGVTMNKECSLLHNILNHNQRYRGLLEGYRIPSFSTRNNVKKREHPRTKIPTIEQYNQIKYWYSIGNNYHGRNFNEIYLLYIRFLCNTGVRVGESLKLTIDDIDDKHQVFWIRNRKSNKGNVINTGFPNIGKVKNIVDRVLEITRESRERTGEKILFINPENDKPLGNIRRSFNRCCKDLNLYYDEEKETYFSLGCFRHYFITKMIKQDIPLSLLSRLVGHTEIYTIQKNYISLRTEDLVKSVSDVYKGIELKKKQRKQFTDNDIEMIEGLTSDLSDI